MVDQLAQEYINKPVVFLEYDIDGDLGNRYNRWWAAYGGTGSVWLPLTMVDSGQQISNGYVDFYNVYKGMVEAELTRPAQAEIEAYSWRAGNKMNFSVRLTNLSGTTLSAENSATIHAIVYEEAHVALTDRIVRAATYQPIIEPLDQGATASYSLETQDLLGVDWHNLYSIVLVDYRPDTSPEKYDMLQAAYAAHPDFRVSPNRLTFMIDPSDTGAPTVRMDFAGPPSLEWTLNENIPWLTASPTSGSLASQSSALISVDPGNFSPGWQPEEEIIIMAESSEGSGFSVTVLVQAYYGELERLYLAALWR